ncbi:MAG: amylo-alpha-1,6-glucosidase, partial [Planctomycetota bacterium]
MEAKRGNDDREDLFTPGRYIAETSGEGAVTLWASLGAMPKLDWSTELARRAEASNGRKLPTVPQRRLARAAADFVVRRRRPDGAPGTTIMAGYPWLRDWGRDTFIALPGLLLSTGRHLVAGQVLSTFAAFVSEGMIPSEFDRQTGQPNYNTVDTSLWFIDASFKYLRATGDRDVFDAVLEPTCHAIVEGYTNGTRDSIGVDPADGLVHAGTPTTRLTWMDGDLDGLPVTPRNGKPVEINA